MKKLSLVICLLLLFTLVSCKPKTQTATSGSEDEKHKVSSETTEPKTATKYKVEYRLDDQIDFVLQESNLENVALFEALIVENYLVDGSDLPILVRPPKDQPVKLLTARLLVEWYMDEELTEKASTDLMPTEEREGIGMIKPSGWQTVKYDFVDGKYLYNRCHLIGYQLTGENRNPKNLITCTRSMNTKSMIEFENKVANYIKKTNNHVLYRVNPVFYEDNLIATGVQIEALSVEDNGKGIKFNVFIYNVEDKIEIDYKTGNSKIKED